MTKTEKLRDYIRSEFDLDLVGFAAASALDGEPEGHRPGELLPGAKSIIVFGRAMADGAVAGGEHAQLRRALLEAEGVGFLPDGRVDMGKYKL